MEKQYIIEKGEPKGILINEGYTYKKVIAGDSVKKEKVKVEFTGVLPTGESSYLFTNYNDSPVYIEIIKK